MANIFMSPPPVFGSGEISRRYAKRDILGPEFAATWTALIAVVFIILWLGVWLSHQIWPV